MCFFRCRICLRVADLKEAGLRLKNEMEVGPGGKQIQIEDPDGNPIELFEPARNTIRRHRAARMPKRWVAELREAFAVAVALISVPLFTHVLLRPIRPGCWPSIHSPAHTP